MSLLSIAPDIAAGAGENLADLGSALRRANAAAATQTTSIAAPAADEVSAAITALFGTHAQGFQALSAKAAAFHDEFVNLLNGGTAHYVSTEAANAQQTLASTGAAANVSFSGKLGPFEYSASETAAGLNAKVSLPTPFGSGPSLSLSATPTSSGADLNVTGTLNTPFGPVKWLTATGSATSSTDGAFSASLTEHTPFGPSASLSVNGTPVSNGNQVGEAVTATGALNTPFGPLDFLTASGNASISTSGAFSASISAHTPGANEGVSVTGTIDNGIPDITGVSINVNGFNLSF